MTLVGIICEYNVFHSGHKRLFEHIREAIPDAAIISIMSGNFTQRGIAAAADKYTRARAALMCGSDVTLELPLPYCCAVAPLFARGGVGLAASLGCDVLAFGSECADGKMLKKVSECLASGRFEEHFSRALRAASPDESYIRVRERVYGELYGKVALKPNDTLAVEYLSCLAKTNVKPLVIARKGEERATDARAAFLKRDFDTLSRLVPEELMPLYRECPAALSDGYGGALLFLLRTAEAEEMCTFSGINHDLAYRMKNTALSCGTLDEFYLKCAAKNYTRARVRRAVLALALGIRDGMFESRPDCALVLSVSKKGREALNIMRERSEIPVYMRPSQVTGRLIYRSDALYSLALRPTCGAGQMMRSIPCIEK